MATTNCTQTEAHTAHSVRTDGGEYLGHCRGRLAEPYVGMPATINLYTDTQAAVVTKVNAKSILVAPVALNESTRRRINAEGEPFPCLAVDGITTEVTGLAQRYSRIDTEQGPRFRNGSISITLGRSVEITDYRY